MENLVTKIVQYLICSKGFTVVTRKTNLTYAEFLTESCLLLQIMGVLEGSWLSFYQILFTLRYMHHPSAVGLFMLFCSGNLNSRHGHSLRIEYQAVDG